jgi:hypothetical protein
MPTSKLPTPSSIEDRLTCQCAISYHQVHFENGQLLNVLDEGVELVTIMEMCHGRCERCGLPFQRDFPKEEL